MTRMHAPPHPGEVLREYLGCTPVSEAAKTLGVSRSTFSRVLAGVAGVSPDMAFRLGHAFGTAPEFWAGMQLKYDLYQAGKIKRPKIKRLIHTDARAKDNSALVLRGMFKPSNRQHVAVEDMRISAWAPRRAG